MKETVITVDDKYTVIHRNGADLRALRHGAKWRDCVGDGLILAMAQRIEELEALLLHKQIQLDRANKDLELNCPGMQE